MHHFKRHLKEHRGCGLMVHSACSECKSSSQSSLIYTCATELPHVPSLVILNAHFVLVGAVCSGGFYFYIAAGTGFRILKKNTFLRAATTETC